MSQITYLVEVENLVKRFGGVVALDGMHLNVRPGTIHAVVGENGAGKSTLMKALAGALRPDSGVIRFQGKPVDSQNPSQARKLGIGIFYQELSIFPHRSVLANLFPNKEPTQLGLISQQLMCEQSAEIIAEIGLDVDLDMPVSMLTLAEQQLVELTRVLLEEPTLLILDEPNSALNEQETQRLFSILRRLRNRGVTQLYVSHRLQEVFSITDEITVCRNGQHVLTESTENLTIQAVVEAMIGGKQGELYPPPITLRNDAPRQNLRVQNLSSRWYQDVSFEVQSGEIVGLAGLEGSGATQILYTLFGMHKAQGDVTLPDGKGIPVSATEAARRNVCLVPADRKRVGLMLDRTIADNIAHVVIGTLLDRMTWIRKAHLNERAWGQIDNLSIKAPSPQTLASQLSGGNQQKVVVGKWLEIAPSVVLMDDPTRGVDVGAKHEIYVLMRELAAEGRIVLFSSTDFLELVGLSDRILTFYQGQLVCELRGDEITENNLLHLVNTGQSL